MRSTRFVIVGGGGAVGGLLADALARAGREVAIVDRDGAPPIDARRSSPALRAALADADCVVLALPEGVALQALQHVPAAMRPGALLVDTLSVKTLFAEAAQLVGGHVELLGLNPMFAPALGFAGRPVLAVEVAPGPRSHELLELLRTQDATVVPLADGRAHDRLTAVLQAAAHASILSLGLALGRMDLDLDTLLAAAPPPFLAQLALLARIAAGSPETYADIQYANPYAGQARAALADALARLDAAALDDEPDAVRAIIEQAVAPLGADRDALAEQAAEMLALLRAPR